MPIKVIDRWTGRFSSLPVDAEEEQAMGTYYAKSIECDEHNLQVIAEMDTSHIVKKSILLHLERIPNKWKKEHKKFSTWFNKQKSEKLDYRRYSPYSDRRTWFLKGVV